MVGSSSWRRLPINPQMWIFQSASSKPVRMLSSLVEARASTRRVVEYLGLLTRVMQLRLRRLLEGKPP